MFRGHSLVTLDVKGRLAVPSRYRERLEALCHGALVITLNPFDPCLSLYPLPEWETIEARLAALSDADKASRRAKQMMRGYACECDLDGQGRILIPPTLREFAGFERDAIVLGQGNRFEVWDVRRWEAQREDWLRSVGEGETNASQTLANLAL